MRQTVKSIRDKKGKEKIAVLTAYDYPMAKLLDESGIDIILVGDSVGMVLLGYDSTVPVTMRDMIHHTKAVSRAVKKALLVADMPYGSYASPEQALRNARRLIQEAGADAVKLEGALGVEASIKILTRSGIPVMGHIGMTPQTASHMGGYRVQGKDKKAQQKLLKEAQLLNQLGVFSMVLECVPASLARQITQSSRVPTMGIGAGPKTDGQVLVLNDMLGLDSKVSPKFVRRYAGLQKMAAKAVNQYVDDVRKGCFPSKEESF